MDTDYTNAINKQLHRLLKRNGHLPKLPEDELRSIILSSNTPSLWVKDRYDPDLEVNASAGQVRLAKTFSNANQKGKLVGQISGPYVLVKALNERGVRQKLPRGRLILRTFQRDRLSVDETVDHKKTKYTYDDRLENLRWATKSQQSLNQKRPTVLSTAGKFGLYEVSIDKDFVSSVVLSVEEGQTRFGLTKTQMDDAVRNFKHASSRAFGYYWRRSKEIEDVEDENWVELKEYNGTFLYDGYMISSMGRVRRLDGTITIGSFNKANGYAYIAVLNEEKTKKKCLVHIAVCEAFHGSKPSENHTVDHIDRNKHNNAATNLRWATPQEQIHNRTL